MDGWFECWGVEIMFFWATVLDEKEGLENGTVGMTMPVPLFRNNDVRNREGIRYGKQKSSGAHPQRQFSRVGKQSPSIRLGGVESFDSLW